MCIGLGGVTIKTLLNIKRIVFNDKTKTRQFTCDQIVSAKRILKLKVSAKKTTKTESKRGKPSIGILRYTFLSENFVHWQKQGRHVTSLEIPRF